ELVADPDAVLGRSDRARPVPDGDESFLPTGRRVEPGHGEVQRVGYPHRCRGDRDAGWSGADLHRAAGLAGGRIDPGHRAVLAVGDPDGVLTDRDAVRAPPTSIFLLVTQPVAGLTRSTALSASLATHTPLGPLPMPPGAFPAG